MLNKKACNVRLLQYLNLGAFLLVLIINYLSATGRINNITPGEVSRKYQTLITPAPYTFSIWGIIYLLLIGFVIFQAKGILFKENSSDKLVCSIGYWFIISCIANILWIFAWHYEKLALSLIIMIVLLISLIQIYQALDIGKDPTSLKERIFVHIPFSVYLGWVTVATVINTAVFLKAANWSGLGFSEEFWFLFAVVIIAITTGRILATRKDAFFALTILWALTGIMYARLMTETVFFLLQA